MPPEPYGFTEVDKDLEGANRFADPLGMQPLWSHFGRQLVPNMTEQTWYVSGFYLLTCLLYLYESHYRPWSEKQENKKTIPVESFYILGEQLFAYAVYENEKRWELPGDQLLKYYYESKADAFGVKIGLKRELLGSQLSAGTWGLYRGAARRSGLLDRSLRRLNSEVYSAFKSDDIGLSPKQRNKFCELIQEAYNNPTVGAVLPLKKDFCRAVSQTLRSMGKNRSLLLTYLITKHQILPKVAEDLFLQKAFDYRRFVNACAQKHKEHRHIFEDIIKCEDFIATLDSIFQFMYAHEKQYLKTVAGKLPIDVEVLTEAHRRFLDVHTRPTKGVAALRYKYFTEGFDGSSKEALLRWLLRMHLKVVESRGGSPWLELDTADRLVIHNEYASSDKLAVIPGKGWMNPYYIDTMGEVYKGLK